MNLSIRRTVRSLLVVVASCAFAAAEAHAQQTCGQFSLSPHGKVDLFAGYVPAFESGDALPTGGVFAIKLRPAIRVIYPYKSDSDHNSGHGGVVAIESIPPGRHRIALSDDAQVDAVQSDSLLHLLAVARDPECPGVYRSVEFVSEGGPLTIQISGARASLITIAVFRLP